MSPPSFSSHSLWSDPESVFSSSSSGDDEGDPMVISGKYWQAKGKILGRCVEMWDTFNGIVDQGVSRDPDLDEDFMHTEL